MDNLQRSALQCVLFVTLFIALPINLSNKSVLHLQTLVYCPGNVSVLWAEPIHPISSIFNSFEDPLVQHIVTKIREQGLQYASAIENSLKVNETN
jgi:hypothetical protein